MKGTRRLRRCEHSSECDNGNDNDYLHQDIGTGTGTGTDTGIVSHNRLNSPPSAM